MKNYYKLEGDFTFMNLKKNFGRKSIFEMSEEEMKFDSLACDLNVEYIEKLVINYRALKFKRPHSFGESKNEDWFLIISTSFECDYKYRITYFDHRGVSGHYDCINENEVARTLMMNDLPDLQEYLIPLEVI